MLKRDVNVARVGLHIFARQGGLDVDRVPWGVRVAVNIVGEREQAEVILRAHVTTGTEHTKTFLGLRGVRWVLARDLFSDFSLG